MLKRLSATGLVAFLVLSASCASSQPVSTASGGVFVSMPLSATVWTIEYSSGDLPAYQSAFKALCRCSELALDRGFRYLRIYDRERLGHGAARWKLQFFDTPPEGAVIIDVAEPTWEDDPPADGVVDAVSFVASCRKAQPVQILGPAADDVSVGSSLDRGVTETGRSGIVRGNRAARKHR